MRWKIVLVMLTVCLTLGLCGYHTEADAASKYKIKVNVQKNTVTVYKLKQGSYKPYKAFVCSVGKTTPIGSFRIYEKRRWHALVENTWGQYSARFRGPYLFHSVPYDSPDASTLFNKEFNKLGKTASHGCIRLTVQDAKWIYDNCSMGTPVEVYKSKNPGPLGKPEAIKVKKKGQGYDPTDKWSKKNPYNRKNPKITGAKDKTIAYGDTEYDVMKGIKAKGTTGYKVTNLIKISIKYRGTSADSYKKVKAVDTGKSGTYRVTYKVTDQIGRKTSVTVKHTVLPKVEEPQPTPVPTPTPMPSATPVASATPTLAPGATAYPSQTPASSSVPVTTPIATPIEPHEDSKKN